MGNILIVDDHLEQCRPLVRLLQMNGHGVACADGGGAALAQLAAGALPDLVVCDVMMPDMDGADVLRRIRSEPRMQHLPVVMYTAVGDGAYLDHLRSLGADDVWVKARTNLDEMMRGIARRLSPNAS